MNPRLLPPIQYGGVVLRAVGPGTTDLRLVQVPCVRAPCPMMPTYNFAVTITVTGRIVPPPPYPTPYPYPYPTPYPPVYPPIGARPDVYIGTSYLMQTVQVQPGQVVELELPFLAPQESVSMSFDPNILQPLDGQDLGAPQIGGWFFRVSGTGTTQLVVKADRCMDGSTTCTPSILFTVTIQSGNATSEGF